MKNYVRNTINLSCAKIVFPIVIVPACVDVQYVLVSKRNAYRTFFGETFRHRWEGVKAKAHTVTCHEDTDGRG